MKSNNSNPEVNVQAQAEEDRIRWNKGPFRFLVERSWNGFKRKATCKRREKVERILGLSIPVLDDDMVQFLYAQAVATLRQRAAFRGDGYTGFDRTPAERDFEQTCSRVIANTPGLKRLQRFPNSALGVDKIVIGYHVPDFFIAGLKSKGTSSLVIEVDGDFHAIKHGRDMAYYSRIREIGVESVWICNSKVNDSTYVRKFLEGYMKPQSGPLDKQVQRNIRDVRLKTISQNMSLFEIDCLVRARFGLSLYLNDEAKATLLLPNCPRKLRAELEGYFDSSLASAAEQLGPFGGIAIPKKKI